MGGLSEKANTLNKIRENTKGRLINVDAGNFLFKRKGQFSSESKEGITAKAIAEIYSLLGFDAVAVGGNDLSGGISLLLETVTLGVPWTSANIFDSEGKPVFEPFRRRQIGDLSIAIVGISDPESVVSTDLVIRKGADVLVDLLPELEDSCDLILLLAAMPLPATVELVGHFPQIDIAIAADNRQGNVAPFLSGTSLLTQTGNRGRYQGVLSVSWNGKPWGNNTTSSLIDLKKRLESVNLQLHRLQNNQGAAVSQKDKIAQLKNSRAELSEQIMRLEEAQKTETVRSYVSTYKHHFLPLKNTGRVDPQIVNIIRNTKKQMAIADKK